MIPLELVFVLFINFVLIMIVFIFFLRHISYRFREEFDETSKRLEMIEHNMQHNELRLKHMELRIDKHHDVSEHYRKPEIHKDIEDMKIVVKKIDQNTKRIYRKTEELSKK
jgi:hypothetical protein